MKNLELTFYSDPGHGWLAVPKSIYKESGAAASCCSYYDDLFGVVYLEEDCDAPKVYKALEKCGYTIKVKHEYMNHNSPIRQLSSMPGY